jgi:hypothetical protein
MKPPAESVREILKGLEGLQMLSQWEQSLAQDLCVKAESLLRAVREAPPANGSEPAGPDNVP